MRQHDQNADQTLTLTIEDLTSEGLGVARRGREVYFVPGALPEERVEVLLDGRRKKVWHTRLRNIEQVSEQRTEPECQHYQRCGGCHLQHMTYEAQLEFKQARVARELQRQKVDVAQWLPAISDQPWGYRRKARLGVRSRQGGEQTYIGFREAASSHLGNIDRCVVLPPYPVLQWSHWRELISQLDGSANITQIEMIDADNALAFVLRVLKPLSLQDIQRLRSFTRQYNEKPVQLWQKTDKEAEAENLDLSPPETLWHQVSGLRLNLALSDFIQVNAGVNRTMVAQAISWLAPKGDDCIWDLFAGHGNFSMPLAAISREVVAVEVQDSMVQNLQSQAGQLSLPITALQADLSQPDCLQSLPDPQAVLLDPPRAGAAAVMAELNARDVERIVYVSCDAATLARDIAQLTKSRYQVVNAGIMDMFPQTHHVETMVLLHRVRK